MLIYNSSNGSHYCWDTLKALFISIIKSFSIINEFKFIKGGKDPPFVTTSKRTAPAKTHLWTHPGFLLLIHNASSQTSRRASRLCLPNGIFYQICTCIKIQLWHWYLRLTNNGPHHQNIDSDFNVWVQDDKGHNNYVESGASIEMDDGWAFVWYHDSVNSYCNGFAFTWDPNGYAELSVTWRYYVEGEYAIPGLYDDGKWIFFSIDVLTYINSVQLRLF
jgi:hypothetical protein